MSKEGLRAYAREVDGDFIVLAGSECRAQWKTSAHHYQRLFETLIAEGKIRIDLVNNNGAFTEDVAFSSPSGAAAIVYGRAANGRTSWNLRGTQKSYGEWQNEILSNTAQLVDPGVGD